MANVNDTNNRLSNDFSLGDDSDIEYIEDDTDGDDEVIYSLDDDDYSDEDGAGQSTDADDGGFSFVEDDTDSDDSNAFAFEDDTSDESGDSDIPDEFADSDDQGSVDDFFAPASDDESDNFVSDDSIEDNFDIPDDDAVSDGFVGDDSEPESNGVDASTLPDGVTAQNEEDIDWDTMEEDAEGNFRLPDGRLVLMDDDGNFYIGEESAVQSMGISTDADTDADFAQQVLSEPDDNDNVPNINLGSDADDTPDTPDVPAEPEVVSPETNDFLDENGNIVVMNRGSAEDTFEIKVISYKNIAIAKRIRSGKNVEDLVMSIKSTGLLNPIVVAPLATENMYVLIDGYRRVLACAKAGLTEIPAVINNKVKTTEIAIVEALYNHKKPYTMQDTIDYIKYLEEEKGLTNPSMIEFLMEMDNGDYSKLKDILSDDDEDIVSKLMLGQLTIQQAFKQLEKRRAKESKEEKDIKKSGKVYGNEEESGADVIAETGETGDANEALTDEQLEALSIDPLSLDDDIEDKSLDDMISESDETPGFEAHQQKVGEREYIDPAIKKTVLARDNFTCACCKRGGQSYVDILDYHHILPVFLGGKDTPENGVALCVSCHRLVHLFSTGDLHLPKEKTEDEINEMSEDDRIIYMDEQKRFKRIVKLGDVIRKGIAQRGMNREQYKREHSNAGIGRRKPGKNAPQEIS